MNWKRKYKRYSLGLSLTDKRNAVEISRRAQMVETENRRFRRSLSLATVTPPRRGGRRTAERDGESWTVWWGFWRSCVAGTGENLTFFTREKVTFFTGEWSLTGGPGMEAGFRRGQPLTGGIPGTTGTENLTGFNLSTDTESDLSPIWIKKKNFRMLDNLIRSSVEKR